MMSLLFGLILGLNIVACINIILVCRNFMDIEIEVVEKEDE